MAPAVAPRVSRSETRKRAAHVVEHGLHQRDRDLGLLYEVVLRVLDLEPRGLLTCGARALEPSVP
jgi:hypothetical protein